MMEGMARHGQLFRWTRDGLLSLPWSAQETFDRLVLNPPLRERLRSMAERFREGADAFRSRDLAWRRGIFFFGAPGTGKSAASRALARVLDWDCLIIPAHEILDSHLFEAALAQICGRSHCVIILEEVEDFIRRMEPHVFFNLLDHAMVRTEGALWCATSRHPELVPKMQLIRPGRFEDSIRLDIPHPELRRELLSRLLPPAAAQAPATLIEASELERAPTLLDELTENTQGLAYSHFEEMRQIAARAELDGLDPASEIRAYAQDQIIAGDRLGGVSDSTAEVEYRIRHMDPRVVKAALDMTDVFRALIEKTLADAAAQQGQEDSADAE